MDDRAAEVHAPRKKVQAPRPGAIKPDPSDGGVTRRVFVFDLTLDRFFAAWHAVSIDARHYGRCRRDANSRKWLGTQCSTRFLWSLVASLQCFVDKTLPAKLFRGMRCRHISTQNAGTFLSSSERGICKVVFDNEAEPTLVPMVQLVRVCVVPHPFLAGLAFLAWALAHAQQEDLKIDSMRTALMFKQVMGKSSGQLTMLAVMQEEAVKGLKFCFAAWKRTVKRKAQALRKFWLNGLKDAFKAWLETLLLERHDRALELLTRTQADLKQLQITALARQAQAERLKGCVLELRHGCFRQFFRRVLFSWKRVCSRIRLMAESRVRARQALAASALQVAEAMGKLTITFLRPHLQAWASRTSQARKLKHAAHNTIKALVSSSLSTVFRAWKQMKLSNYQTLVAKLHQREREYSELHELSESFFQCSREGSQRLKAMESAAQAADRVLQIGAARADSLEAEAKTLRQTLLEQMREGAASRGGGGIGGPALQEMEEKCREELLGLSRRAETLEAELEASRGMEVKLRLGEAQTLRAGAQSALADAAAEARDLREAAARAERQEVELAQLQRARSLAELQVQRSAEEAAPGVRRHGAHAAHAAPAAGGAAASRAEAAEAASASARLGDRATQTSLPPGLASAPPPAAEAAPSGSRSLDHHRKFVNAWKPNGRDLPDTADEKAMSFDLASNILRTGAYFKKKAGRRSSVTRYFFVGEPGSAQGFLRYFRDHKAAVSAATPRGGFDLVDLVRANWDGLQCSITLTQSTKTDASERGLVEIPQAFFQALLFAVHEAEFRRQHPDCRDG
ncbi:SKOR [Symbiodinium sp. CCMP2592]|nr:SKOR [Symbiodinium sp. CCMP2592]